jgi:ubiquinone/menaquinone biosynthesis C-methylase UbiE
LDPNDAAFGLTFLQAGCCRWECRTSRSIRKDFIGVQLNWIERLFILSPIRALLQRHWEARQLLAMGGPLTGAHVLETGCGPGFGIDLLYRRFKVARVDAFDIDPKMIALVRQRRRNPAIAELGCGWATFGTFPWPTPPTTRLSISARFTMWTVGVRQSAKSFRVLKPGGSVLLRRDSQPLHHPSVAGQAHGSSSSRIASIPPQFIYALQQNDFRLFIGYRQLAHLYLWEVAIKSHHGRHGRG